MSDTSDPLQKTRTPAWARPDQGSRSKKKWLLGGIISFLCIAIGVGVGVGVGVGTKKHHSPAQTSQASAGESFTGNGSAPLEITRQELLGDQKRWYGSGRQFPTGAPPTMREYDWTISTVTAAPGALAKTMIVVNGVSSSGLESWKRKESWVEFILSADIPSLEASQRL